MWVILTLLKRLTFTEWFVVWLLARPLAFPDVYTQGEHAIIFILALIWLRQERSSNG